VQNFKDLPDAGGTFRRIARFSFREGKPVHKSI
jgi:hypothetical protein